MAVFEKLTGDALTKKLWDSGLWTDVRKLSLFKGLTSSDGTMPVHEKMAWKKSKGDRITFGLVPRLGKNFLVGGASAEGQENKISDFDYSITLDMRKLPVRYDLDLSDQRTMYGLGEENRKALVTNVAENLDQYHMDILTTSPTKVFHPSGVEAQITSAASVDAAKLAITVDDKIKPDSFRFLRSWAFTGGDRAYIPLRPFKIGGGNYLVLLAHPDVLADFRVDSTFQEGARLAEKRGKDNPLFAIAESVIDNVIIIESEFVPIGTDAGVSGNVPYAHCTLIGAQSLVIAWARIPRIVTRDFGYDEERGLCWKGMFQIGKPVFDSKDYGSIAFIVARTNVAGL